MKRLLFLLAGFFLLTSCAKNYKMPPGPGRVIKQFKLETGQYGNETISMDGGIYKVTVLVNKNADLSSLIPRIIVSDGASISPASGEKISVSGTNKYQYTVTAASGDKMEWNVEFVVVDKSVSDYGAYTISSATGGKFIEIAGDITNNQKFTDNALAVLNEASVSSGSVNLWQKWHVIYKVTVNDIKYYQIRNMHSGMLLSAPVGGTASGAQLKQQSEVSPSTDLQLWKIEETASPGMCKVINKGNGLALSNESGSSANGAKVIQENVSSADKQKWTFAPVDLSSYRDDEVVRFFNRNLNSQGSVAFDEGTSIPLKWGANNGKVLWVTQDAWDGASLLPNKMFGCSAFFSYGNSIMIQPSATNWDNTATTNMTITNSAQNKPKQICNIQPNNSFAWPGPGVEIDNRVYIQCGEGNGLNSTNQSLYELTQDAGNQWTSVRTTPAGLSGQVDINYSAGMVKGTDGYVYSFGSQSTGFGYESNIHVARFPVSNPQQWTFWNGSSWASAPTTGTTARIADALGSTSVAYLNGKYILMTMDQGFNCDAKRNIYISTSTSPTGPFINKKLVYTINEYFGGQYARYYTPSVHPEFDNGHNELLVTYCLNYSACGLNSCENGYQDPYYYRVKGVRVPFSLIGL